MKKKNVDFRGNFFENCPKYNKQKNQRMVL